MATVTSKRRSFSAKNSAQNEEVYVKMPQSDMAFFQLFADKMGWLVENKTELLRKYISSRPKNVDLPAHTVL